LPRSAASRPGGSEIRPPETHLVVLLIAWAELSYEETVSGERTHDAVHRPAIAL
jgi:hypothetical protein